MSVLVTDIRCFECRSTPTACSSCAEVAQWADRARTEGLTALVSAMPDVAGGDWESGHVLADDLLAAALLYLAEAHPQREQLEAFVSAYLSVGKWYA